MSAAGARALIKHAIPIELERYLLIMEAYPSSMDFSYMRKYI